MSSSRDSTISRQPSQNENMRSKRGPSSPPQVTGRENDRRRRTRSPSPNPRGSSTRRRPLDAADLLSRVLPEWEIHETTHILLHLTKCDSCADFASHVANQTQGGALEIFIDKQRRHWRRVFEEDNRLDRKDAFQAGVRSADREIDELKDDLDRCHRRVESLERENDKLREKIHRLENRPNTQGSHFGRGEARGKHTGNDVKRPQSPVREYERSQPPPVPGPSLLSRIEGKSPPSTLKLAPSTKGKENEDPITPETPSVTVEPTPRPPSPASDASSNVRVLGTGKAPRMYESDDSDMVSIPDDEGLARPDTAQEEEASSSSMAIDSVRPSRYSRYIGDQAPFRLDKKSGSFLSKYGHVCVSQPTHWNCSSSALFAKAERFKGYRFWVSGFPMQMAKEASLVPFDQRSDAQRWTVREATRDGYLPLLSARAEPDVEKLAEENRLPSFLRRDPDGRLNVKDVTAWMLLKMAEPEESQLTEWFWWTSCVLFERLGAYKEALDKLGLRDEPRGYVPIRLTFVKELTSDDVALHFHRCGVQVADCTSYLWDFSKNYLRGRRPPASPMWSALPPSRPRESRPSTSQRKKRGSKAFTDRGQQPPRRIASHTVTEPVSESARHRQDEERVQGSSRNDTSMHVDT